MLDWMVLNKCAWGLNLQIISGMFSAFALYGFILLFGAVLYAKAHSAVTLLGFSEPKAIFVRQNDVHDFRDTLQAKDIGEGFQHIFKVIVDLLSIRVFIHTFAWSDCSPYTAFCRSKITARTQPEELYLISAGQFLLWDYTQIGNGCCT